MQLNPVITQTLPRLKCIDFIAVGTSMAPIHSCHLFLVLHCLHSIQPFVLVAGPHCDPLRRGQQGATCHSATPGPAGDEESWSIT